MGEAIRQAKEVKGKNITREEAQEALKATKGNFKSLLRGLGIQGSDKSCPNNCNGHGKCVKGLCHCDPGFAGSKDCKKPVASGEACYTCCAFEGLDNCLHFLQAKTLVNTINATVQAQINA